MSENRGESFVTTTFLLIIIRIIIYAKMIESPSKQHLIKSFQNNAIHLSLDIFYNTWDHNSNDCHVKNEKCEKIEKKIFG